MSDMRHSTESNRSRPQPAVRSRSSCQGVKRSEASRCGPKPRPKQNCLSYPSFSQLQAQVEAEYQQAQEIVQPLLDANKGFMKELNAFLSQRDLTELRRKELLHKSWTQHVWFPLQKKVEERVSSYGPADSKRRQTSYSHYLHQCNAKGFVFLETYDQKECDPFSLNTRKQHYRGRLREKRTSPSNESGPKHASRKTEERPQNEHRLTESHVSKRPPPPLSFSVLALRKTPSKDEPGRRKSSK